MNPDLIKVIEKGLELVVDLLSERSPSALDRADDAARALLDGVSGKTSLEIMAADLAAIMQAHDDAADKALANKFDHGGEG